MNEAGTFRVRAFGVRARVMNQTVGGTQGGDTAIHMRWPCSGRPPLSLEKLSHRMLAKGGRRCGMTGAEARAERGLWVGVPTRSCCC